MRVKDYKELRVYRLAYEAAMEIFRLSRQWPSEEKFSLTDQIRRSSRSVCTNIAEAWRKRRYQAAFVSKLSDSDTEAAETEVHLSFALDCGYIGAEVQKRLLDHYDHICRQLSNMMSDAASWCGTGCELREVPSEYVVTSEHREGVERQSVERVERDDVDTSSPHSTDASRSKALRYPRSSRSRRS